MKELDSAQQRKLRALAHHLNPVVSISGNGLSEAVLKEIDCSLNAHELIKIRVYSDDRAFRIDLMTQICAQLKCTPVQTIGKLLVVFRKAPEPEEKPAAARKPRALPRAPKLESGRTARTTTGTSAVRRLGNNSAARPGSAPRPHRSRRPPKR